MHKYATRVFTITLLACACAFADASALSLAVTSTRLTVTGATARGEVVLFGRSGTYESGMPLRKRHLHVLRDDDGNGVVTLDTTEVPRYSTWAAVDMESGEFALGAPASFPLRVIELPPLVWRGGVSHVDIGRDVVDVLFVRPKKGAWLLDLWQGGRRDADGRDDANLRAGLTPLQAIIGKDSPPPTATARDVLILIDIRELDVYARSAQ